MTGVQTCALPIWDSRVKRLTGVNPGAGSKTKFPQDESVDASCLGRLDPAIRAGTSDARDARDKPAYDVRFRPQGTWHKSSNTIGLRVVEMDGHKVCRDLGKK